MSPSQQKKAEEGLALLLREYGGECVQLARVLNLNPSRIRQWKTRGFVSAPGSVVIADRLGSNWAVTCRPDLSSRF